jgi:hypothetical protein
MLATFIKKLFSEPEVDPLIEGRFADQYPEEEGGEVRSYIRTQYRQRWPSPESDKTPLTHPWLYDPCDPPRGWRYDPYYELWMKI